MEIVDGYGDCRLRHNNEGYRSVCCSVRWQGQSVPVNGLQSVYNLRDKSRLLDVCEKKRAHYSTNTLPIRQVVRHAQ